MEPGSVVRPDAAIADVAETLTSGTTNTRAASARPASAPTLRSPRSCGVNAMRGRLISTSWLQPAVILLDVTVLSITTSYRETWRWRAATTNFAGAFAGAMGAGEIAGVHPH